MHSKLIMRYFYFGLDSNELRRKLARGEEEQADKIREFNEEVQLLVIICKHGYMYMREGNKNSSTYEQREEIGLWEKNWPHAVQYTVKPDYVGVCLELINICVN